MKRFPLELLCLVFEMAMVQDVPTEEYGEPVSVHRAFFSSTAPELTLMVRPPDDSACRAALIGLW